MVVEKVALCITNYDRYELLFNSFQRVMHDKRIGEIIISDDNSRFDYLTMVVMKFKELNKSGVPIRLVTNDKNIGCYHNKARALEYVSYEYAILLDSDNVINGSYLDGLFDVPPQYWDGKTILAPEAARPAFRYHQFAASYFDKNSIKQHIPTMQRTQFDCLINCANYVVPVKEYLRVFDPDFKRRAM